jgi:hypothetical protein
VQILQVIRIEWTESMQLCLSLCLSFRQKILKNEVIGFFSIDLILLAALGPGVHSASNRNEYQELIK